MHRLKEIEAQIQRLSLRQFAELREWILERDQDIWDSQIESDANSGKLVKLISVAKTEYDRGKTRQ